ncbi:MAG: hypothetical protein KW804_00595 [Candidatus Doudnabacteria bacterium]|nr:hypothetical protein [Candidatus Doudnabacteria bacterium]
MNRQSSPKALERLAIGQLRTPPIPLEPDLPVRCTEGGPCDYQKDGTEIRCSNCGKRPS